MAKATLKNEVIKVVEEKSVEQVVLTLSRDEAQTLLKVCRNIGGCPVNSPRLHTDSINKALVDAKITVPNNISCNGDINFKDYE